MAKIAHSTPTPTIDRRRLGAGLLAIVAGSGITAGAAASVADFVPTDTQPDAALLALRAELTAAVADVSMTEMEDGVSDDAVTAAGERLLDACWAIVDAPPAQTAAGRALKAAAAMQELRYSFHAQWHGEGEAMAWDVLSELAGSAYVPVGLPDRLRHLEPARA